MTNTNYLARQNDFKNIKYETPLKKTITGIVRLPKERQLFTLKQASDPELIKGIAEKTSHAEVKNSALAHKNFPHNKSGTKKNPGKKNK